MNVFLGVTILKSISAKLLIRMLIVSMTGMVIGLFVIMQASSKLHYSTAQNLVNQKKEWAESLIDSKVQNTLSILLSSISTNPEWGEYFVNKDVKGMHQLANKLSDSFASKTTAKGLNFVAFDNENRIFMRSFKPLPDAALGKKAPRNFSDLLSGKQPLQAKIDLSGVGLFITATVPVVSPSNDSEIVGVLDIRSGLESVVEELSANGTYFLAVINEKGLERWKKGSESDKLGSYYLANKKWFSSSQEWFRSVDIDQLVHEKFINLDDRSMVSKPILNGQGEVVGHYLIGLDESHPDMLNAMQGVNQIILLMVILVVVLVVLLLILLAYSTRVIVQQPIQSILQAIRSVHESGHFTTNLHSDSKDEVGEMLRAFNALMQRTNSALQEANATVGAIAKGNFTKRMEQDYIGDLLTLKEGVNQSAHSVEFVMTELQKVMQGLVDGQFDIRMSDQVAQNFRDDVDKAMHSIQTVIQQVNQAMQAMNSGDFSSRVECEARGELRRLVNHVNDSVKAIDSAIYEILDVASAQSQGDLTRSVNGDYKGQLNELKLVINASNSQLNEIVMSAMQIANQVSGAAQEVSLGANDLSDQVQQQAASVEQTSATMTQMNVAVQNNREHVEKASEEAQKVKEKVVHGSEVMQQNINAINAIQESSHKINDIVGLIDSIAFQTNLLALNAAVEAARAGEHGRGFAVVASEVRALAQKSAEAAKEITALVNENTVSIEQGTELTQQSGEVLQQIHASVELVSDMIQQIDDATAEQATGIEQVHKAIDLIDSGAQQNAALVEQTSAASESLTEQAQSLRADMGKFKTKNLLPSS